MAKKITTDEVSSIASRGLKDPGSLSKKEIKIISASALGQDESTPKPTSPSASKPAPEKAAKKVAKKAAAAKKKT